jgi:hypothetical protein
MDLFSHTPTKKGEKIRDYFWGFLCGVVNIRHKKLVHDA